MKFELPPALVEIRHLCPFDPDMNMQFVVTGLMLRSDVEDWLEQQNTKYEVEQYTVNDGWFNRVCLYLTIDDEIIALQFKLIWL
jgi:hypothetical protein